MPTGSSLSPLAREAEALATRMLASLPTRLAHSRACAFVAAMAAGGMSIESADAVVAAAWLHDVGYSPRLRRRGFHPVDGAEHLSAEGWPEEVTVLVAHHSHAAMLAPYYGAAARLHGFGRAERTLDDIITYADLRAGVDGKGSSVHARVEEMRIRHADRTFIPGEVQESRYRQLLSSAARIDAVLHGATSVGWSSSHVHP